MNFKNCWFLRNAKINNSKEKDGERVDGTKGMEANNTEKHRKKCDAVKG